MIRCLASSIASGLRHGGEALTLRKQAAGSFNVATQTYTPGAVTDTATYGLVQLIDSGIDGVTTQRGDLEVWMPKVQLDAEGVTPSAGDYLVRGTQVLVLLDLETQAVAGYYRARARAAE